MKYLLFSLSLLVSWPLFAWAQESVKSPFIAVLVDDATEKELGRFPFDRAEYAKALSVLRQAHAKAVVINFFLYQSKPGPGDDELSAEIKKIPVLLKVGIGPQELHPNVSLENFGCGSRVNGDTHSLSRAESLWLPLDKFRQGCVGIGFGDIASMNDVLKIPMVLRYRDTLVPSLELGALEMAFGRQAQIFLGDQMTLAGHSLPVDRSGAISVKLPAKDQIDSISFFDVIQGKFDSERIAGKIVILDFDAKETPNLEKSLGPLPMHRLFYPSLESLYEQLMAH